MCIQLCCQGQSYVCSLDSEKELFIQACSQITKKYIDWHENPALQCDSTLDSLMISFDFNQYEACNSYKILYLALKLTIPLNQGIVSASPNRTFSSLLLSLSRFSYCMSSSSAGARHGLVYRGMASCVRTPVSQNLLLVLLRLPQCTAVLAPPDQTPVPAVPLQILAPP